MVHVNQGEGEKYNAILHFNQKNPEPGSSGTSTNYFYAALHNKEYFENQKYIKPVLCTNFREAWDIKVINHLSKSFEIIDSHTWCVFTFNKPDGSDDLNSNDLVVAEYANPLAREYGMEDWEERSSHSSTQWVFKYRSQHSSENNLDDENNLDMRLVIYRPKAIYKLES